MTALHAHPKVDLIGSAVSLPDDSQEYRLGEVNYQLVLFPVAKPAVPVPLPSADSFVFVTTLGLVPAEDDPEDEAKNEVTEGRPITLPDGRLTLLPDWRVQDWAEEVRHGFTYDPVLDWVVKNNDDPSWEPVIVGTAELDYDCQHEDRFATWVSDTPDRNFRITVASCTDPTCVLDAASQIMQRYGTAWIRQATHEPVAVHELIRSALGVAPAETTETLF